MLSPDDLNIIAAQVDYGSEKLTAMIENDNFCLLYTSDAADD